MEAKSRWWVTELLAAGCERAWIHAGWEDTLQENGTNGFLEISKTDEKEKIEEMHQHKVAQMIKECGGKRGSLAQNLPSLKHGEEERRSW